MASGATPSHGYRIGIDVGGTFTKAVLIDNATREVVGRHSVLTTHDHPSGVASGVVEVFRQVLAGSGVAPEDVVFLAHSTTQATNALLEGDVARVGVVGMASAAAADLAEKQARIGAHRAGAGTHAATGQSFPRHRHHERGRRAAGHRRPRRRGRAGAGGLERVRRRQHRQRGAGAQARRPRPACSRPAATRSRASTGSTTRTRTAVINASILPRMIATATMTEASVREAGIVAPLMIMRGDGGVMDINEMRRRPVMTMLSGPAASVAGALMHLRISDGLYFEVGGTSTNIGVIRNGRPTVTYARVGGHETYVSSLDVRVIGIAGGSLVRAAADGTIAMSAPAAPTSPACRMRHSPTQARSSIRASSCSSPKPGDGDDYVAVRVAGGARYALP